MQPPHHHQFDGNNREFNALRFTLVAKYCQEQFHWQLFAISIRWNGVLLLVSLSWIKRLQWKEKQSHKYTIDIVSLLFSAFLRNKSMKMINKCFWPFRAIAGRSQCYVIAENIGINLQFGNDMRNSMFAHFFFLW